jgi:hypothetical protein
MRAPLVIVALVGLAATVAATPPVSVYIAPRSSIIPASGKVIFDIYWFNRSERPATIPTLESYSFSYDVISRSRRKLPSFRGSVVSSLHRDANRPIPARTIVRDELETSIEAKTDDFVEVTAEFWGKGGETLKSNTVVLVKRRWPKHGDRKA